MLCSMELAWSLWNFTFYGRHMHQWKYLRDWGRSVSLCLEIFFFIFSVWSTFKSFRLRSQWWYFFYLHSQKKPSKLSHFQYDCILSALTDFIALSIFIHQYLFYRKGLEFIVVYGCLLLINLTFLASIKVISSHLQQDLNAQHNLHDIMLSRSECNASESFDNWIRKIDKPAESNYTFQVVIDEINSIYSWFEILLGTIIKKIIYIFLDDENCQHVDMTECDSNKNSCEH
jgi:hypothetical protein